MIEEKKEEEIIDLEGFEYDVESDFQSFQLVIEELRSVSQGESVDVGTILKLRRISVEIFESISRIENEEERRTKVLMLIPLIKSTFNYVFLYHLLKSISEFRGGDAENLNKHDKEMISLEINSKILISRYDKSGIKLLRHPGSPNEKRAAFEMEKMLFEDHSMTVSPEYTESVRECIDFHLKYIRSGKSLFENVKIMRNKSTTFHEYFKRKEYSNWYEVDENNFLTLRQFVNRGGERKKEIVSLLYIPDSFHFEILNLGEGYAISNNPFLMESSFLLWYDGFFLPLTGRNRWKRSSEQQLDQITLLGEGFIALEKIETSDPSVIVYHEGQELEYHKHMSSPFQYSYGLRVEKGKFLVYGNHDIWYWKTRRLKKYLTKREHGRIGSNPSFDPYEFYTLRMILFALRRHNEMEVLAEFTKCMENILIRNVFCYKHSLKKNSHPLSQFSKYYQDFVILLCHLNYHPCSEFSKIPLDCVFHKIIPFLTEIDIIFSYNPVLRSVRRELFIDTKRNFRKTNNSPEGNYFVRKYFSRIKNLKRKSTVPKFDHIDNFKMVKFLNRVRFEDVEELGIGNYSKENFLFEFSEFYTFLFRRILGLARMNDEELKNREHVLDVSNLSKGLLVFIKKVRFFDPFPKPEENAKKGYYYSSARYKPKQKVDVDINPFLKEIEYIATHPHFGRDKHLMVGILEFLCHLIPRGKEKKEEEKKENEGSDGKYRYIFNSKFDESRTPRILESSRKIHLLNRITDLIVLITQSTLVCGRGGVPNVFGLDRYSLCQLYKEIVLSIDHFIRVMFGPHNHHNNSLPMMLKTETSRNRIEGMINLLDEIYRTAYFMVRSREYGSTPVLEEIMKSFVFLLSSPSSPTSSNPTPFFSFLHNLKHVYYYRKLGSQKLYSYETNLTLMVLLSRFLYRIFRNIRAREDDSNILLTQWWTGTNPNKILRIYDSIFSSITKTANSEFRHQRGYITSEVVQEIVESFSEFFEVTWKWNQNYVLEFIFCVENEEKDRLKDESRVRWRNWSKLEKLVSDFVSSIFHFDKNRKVFPSIQKSGWWIIRFFRLYFKHKRWTNVHNRFLILKKIISYLSFVVIDHQNNFYSMKNIFSFHHDLIDNSLPLIERIRNLLENDSLPHSKSLKKIQKIESNPIFGESKKYLQNFEDFSIDNFHHELSKMEKIVDVLKSQDNQNDINKNVGRSSEFNGMGFVMFVECMSFFDHRMKIFFEYSSQWRKYESGTTKDFITVQRNKKIEVEDVRKVCLHIISNPEKTLQHLTSLLLQIFVFLDGPLLMTNEKNEYSKRSKLLCEDVKLFLHEHRFVLEYDFDFLNHRLVFPYFEKSVGEIFSNLSFETTTSLLDVLNKNDQSVKIRNLFLLDKAFWKNGQVSENNTVDNMKSINFDVPEYIFNRFIFRSVDESDRRILLDNQISDFVVDLVLNIYKTYFFEDGDSGEDEDDLFVDDDRIGKRRKMILPQKVDTFITRIFSNPEFHANVSGEKVAEFVDFTFLQHPKFCFPSCKNMVVALLRFSNKELFDETLVPELLSSRTISEKELYRADGDDKIQLYIMVLEVTRIVLLKNPGSLVTVEDHVRDILISIRLKEKFYWMECRRKLNEVLLFCKLKKIFSEWIED